MNQMVDYSAITWLGLGVVAAFVGYVFYQKRYVSPDKNIGTIITDLFVKAKETFFLTITIAANFFEALMAASIHPKGQIPPNIFARFGTHLIVALLGIASAIYYPMYVSHALSAPNWRSKAIYALVALVAFVGAIGFPVGNVFIIANGVGDTVNATLIIKHTLWWITPWVDSGAALEYILVHDYNLPANYNPWQECTYVMFATMMMTFCHIVAINLHSLGFSAATKVYGYTDPKETDNLKKRHDNKKKDDLSNYRDNVMYCLKRVKYSPGKELNDAWKKANDILSALDTDRDQYELSGRVARLANSIRTYDKSESKKKMSPDNRKKKDLEYAEKIFTLWEGSSSGGKGFGHPLKRKGPFAKK